MKTVELRGKINFCKHDKNKGGKMKERFLKVRRQKQKDVVPQEATGLGAVPKIVVRCHNCGNESEFLFAMVVPQEEVKAKQASLPSKPKENLPSKTKENPQKKKKKPTKVHVPGENGKALCGIVLTPEIMIDSPENENEATCGNCINVSLRLKKDLVPEGEEK